nr:AraC family transcriptional regulator [Vibrio albus]
MWFFLLLFAAGHVSAHHDDLYSVYHPLPFQEQGLFFTAKNMFPGAAGGLWLHDIYGNIRFFDGQHVLPRVGSAIDKPVGEVVFLDQAFWYVEENRLYKSYPAGHSEFITTLGVGTEITRMGCSDRKIWATDNKNFYVYDPDTGEVKKYSLHSLQSRFDGVLEITSAIFIKKRWVLGTIAEVFITHNNQLSHAKLSGKKYVETLYYSESREELLVGGRNGAVLIDINKPEKVKVHIGHSLVRSIIESEDGYWVGTEHGLYVYQFSNKAVREIGTNHQDDYALSNGFIYSLVNDQDGGIWIATGQEIRYYSLSSELFTRIRLDGLSDYMDIGSINQIITDDNGEYWIATDKGLYSYDSIRDEKPIKRVYQPVYGIALYKGTLWLAMGKGIATYHKESYLFHWQKHPEALTSRGIRHITVDSSGGVWFDSEQGLIRYDISNSSADNLTHNWQVNHTKGVVIHLYADSQNRVYIGTDHGTYLYADNHIQYLKTSEVLGNQLDMVETEHSDLWSVYSYGLYRSQNSPVDLEPVVLNEPNVRVLCAVSTPKGVWAASSKGLTLYRHDGVLAKHFSAPFGLINNEFLPDSCSYNPQNDELIFGSRFGLVLANQSALIATELPENKVLTSQVLVNNQPHKIGFDTEKVQTFSHGNSLTFVFGVLPDFDQNSLEYKLAGSNETDWIVLQGKELTFSSLLPGTYKLYVRTDAQAALGQQGSLLRFKIQPPWYLSSWALSFFSILIITKVILLMHWRSERMLRLNRYLQKLVRIKTCQLENQSQALMVANHRLKQELKEQSENGSVDSPKPAITCCCQNMVSESRSEKSVTISPWLEKVHSLINQEYRNPDFGTSLAAKRLYVSERSLQRKFKSLTGMTFTEQLYKIRLEKACERLLSGDKISDAAFDTGFNDASYFSQRFKNYYGISPSTFIESHSEQP